MLNEEGFFQAAERLEKERVDRIKTPKEKMKASDWTLFSGRSGGGKLFDLPNDRFHMMNAKINKNQRAWVKRAK